MEDQHLSLKRQNAEARNSRFFDEEADKLERWGEDLKKGLKVEIEELDQKIAELNRAARKTQSLAEKLTLQKQLRDLEHERKHKRQRIYEQQDAIDERRQALIAQVEAQLKAQEALTTIFTVQWQLES